MGSRISPIAKWEKLDGLFAIFTVSGVKVNSNWVPIGQVYSDHKSHLQDSAFPQEGSKMSYSDNQKAQKKKNLLLHHRFDQEKPSTN